VVVGWTLDFMRRRPDGINGVMEFLIAESAARMRDDGVEFMSLSAAPLAHTAEVAPGEEASGMDRTLAYLSASLEPVYGFRSLLKFKRKFQPELHPLIMAYPDPVALPMIGVALVRAYLPQLSVRQAANLARGRG
jgi:phosphatidylglycerol lysyltransferase